VEGTRDITIVGGGPTGLFAAFYAGMRGLSTRIVDSLPELGGQLMALYPEKYIYDVGGFPKILAKDLAQSLIEQALQFDPEVVLDREIGAITEQDGAFQLASGDEVFHSKSLLVAGGKGAFEPRRLECPGYDAFLGNGVEYAVRDPASFAGKRVVIVGGGDSALDWAVILKDHCERLIVTHRRDQFRAHEVTVQAAWAAHEAGQLEMAVFHEVRSIEGDGRVEQVTLFDNRTDEEITVEADAVLTFLGFKPDLGPMREWGLDLKGNRILVNQLMETNRPGIYGAGDIVQYEGKLDLIATGFSEAAIAVNNAVHYVDPDARVNPGHSTNLKIFGDG